MSVRHLLIANIGAEESRDPPARASAAAARTAARLWAALFEPPAFDWLPDPELAVAWLNTEEAAREARAAGRRLFGAAPAVVAEVHDKAFALGVAEREGLVPDSLKGLCAAFEPGELAEPGAALAALRERLARWPGWARQSFTLKPRCASSGRGRVAGRSGEVDTPALRGALPRLARRGGALLEPWLRRSEDLSAQLSVDAAGTLRLVGTSRPVLTPSGLYRGQRGSVDVRGRVVSGSGYDEALREAAARVTGAAAARGFVGACGLDAFAFETPDGSVALRPVVEFNARFTLGHVAIGWVRRLLPEVVAHFGLAGGDRCAFHFGLAPPPGGWPAASRELRVVPLAAAEEEAGPALVFAPSDEALERGLAPRS